MDFHHLLAAITERLKDEQSLIEETVEKIEKVTTLGSGVVHNTIIFPENLVQFIGESRYEVDFEITIKKIKS